MSLVELIAEAGSMNNGTIEIGAFSALLGGGAFVGRAMLARLEKTLEKLDLNHAEQLRDLRDSHDRQLEILQSAHASQVETLTGISVDNQRAMTALTVQLDRYTREMHCMSETINLCPEVMKARASGKMHAAIHDP